MDVERVSVIDLTTGVDPADAPAPRPRRSTRRAPRWLVLTIGVSLAAGVLGATALHANQLRQVTAETDLTVLVAGARAAQEQTSDPTGNGRVEADVTLTLSVSVPVRVIAAELDGAPPVSRPAAGAASRTPAVTVRWQVLCAEVGTIPGPRLLDVDLRAQSGVEHRRVRLATDDTDEVSRVFRLSASQACAALRP